MHPDLSLVARSYLGINSSSTESERIFSVCGYITEGRKNRISAKHLWDLLHLHECVKCRPIWDIVKRMR